MVERTIQMMQPADFISRLHFLLRFCMPTAETSVANAAKHYRNHNVGEFADLGGESIYQQWLRHVTTHKPGKVTRKIIRTVVQSKSDWVGNTKFDSNSPENEVFKNCTKSGIEFYKQRCYHMF